MTSTHSRASLTGGETTSLTESHDPKPALTCTVSPSPTRSQSQSHTQSHSLTTLRSETMRLRDETGTERGLRGRVGSWMCRNAARSDRALGHRLSVASPEGDAERGSGRVGARTVHAHASLLQVRGVPLDSWTGALGSGLVACRRAGGAQVAGHDFSDMRVGWVQPQVGQDACDDGSHMVPDLTRLLNTPVDARGAGVVLGAVFASHESSVAQRSGQHG